MQVDPSGEGPLLNHFSFNCNKTKERKKYSHKETEASVTICVKVEREFTLLFIVLLFWVWSVRFVARWLHFHTGTSTEFFPTERDRVTSYNRESWHISSFKLVHTFYVVLPKTISMLKCQTKTWRSVGSSKGNCYAQVQHHRSSIVLDMITLSIIL